MDQMVTDIDHVELRIQENSPAPADENPEKAAVTSEKAKRKRGKMARRRERKRAISKAREKQTAPVSSTEPLDRLLQERETARKATAGTSGTETRSQAAIAARNAELREAVATTQAERLGLTKKQALHESWGKSPKRHAKPVVATPVEPCVPSTVKVKAAAKPKRAKDTVTPAVLLRIDNLRTMLNAIEQVSFAAEADARDMEAAYTSARVEAYDCIVDPMKPAFKRCALMAEDMLYLNTLPGRDEQAFRLPLHAVNPFYWVVAILHDLITIPGSKAVDASPVVFRSRIT